jgi:hypothetical protein
LFCSFPEENGLKQENGLSGMLFIFASEYSLGKVKEKEDGLELHGTHQLLVCDDTVILLGENIDSRNKNTGTV